MYISDVIIIGSGIAALQLANELSEDKNVIIFTKAKLFSSNSYLAQGGIAAVTHENDHIEKHIFDTLVAGEYYNDPKIVSTLVTEGAKAVKKLVDSGCNFDRDVNGQLILGLEGAHSENRILHGQGDATGKVITSFLVNKLKKNIQIIEHFFVSELLVNDNMECFGIKGINNNGQVQTYYSSHVVLATGGCGQLYEYTSNHPSITGDGIALAYTAGADIADMEFIQFHPTLLFTNGQTRGLVSEAVRGEGAKLVTKKGYRIMEKVHSLMELAPRHIVAQVIYDYLQNGEQVYLDITKVENFRERFPTITTLCAQYGIDLDEGLIPIAPGSHFVMGGVVTDEWGRTSLKGLYAIGETACAGVHGANRLASNSLLEGLVFGKRLARIICEDCSSSILFNRNNQHVLKPIFFKYTLPSKEEIQKRMMGNAGIVRDYKTLQLHLQWLESFMGGSTQADLTIEEMTIRNMLIVSWLITAGAIERQESRGGHYRLDYSYPIDHWKTRKIIRNRAKVDSNLFFVSNSK